MFRGNCLAKVDERGRLKLPADARLAAEQAGDTEFYITSVDGRSVQIYPLSDWNRLQSELQALGAVRDVEAFMDTTAYWGQQVRMDPQGRLLLPQLLRAEAQIEGEVVVIGSRNHIQVHRRDHFERQVHREPPPEPSDQ